MGKVECSGGSGVDLDPCCGVGEGAGKGFALDGVVIEIRVHHASLIVSALTPEMRAPNAMAVVVASDRSIARRSLNGSTVS